MKRILKALFCLTAVLLIVFGIIACYDSGNFGQGNGDVYLDGVVNIPFWLPFPSSPSSWFHMPLNPFDDNIDGVEIIDVGYPARTGFFVIVYSYEVIVALHENTIVFWEYRQERDESDVDWLGDYLNRSYEFMNRYNAEFFEANQLLFFTVNPSPRTVGLRLDGVNDDGCIDMTIFIRELRRREVLFGEERVVMGWTHAVEVDGSFNFNNASLNFNRVYVRIR